MKLLLTRYSTRRNSTLGTLHTIINGVVTFICYTLEDGHREPKVYGETRIPVGEYEIKLRNAGGVNDRYARRYIQHRGMLHLQDVKNFEWIYIHEGNTHKHTEGCILVGETAVTNVKTDHKLRDSEAAYERLYNAVLPFLQNGEQVFITIENIEGIK